jgi:hypothetical protein
MEKCSFMDAAVSVNETDEADSKKVGPLESHCSLGLVSMAQSWGKQFAPSGQKKSMPTTAESIILRSAAGDGPEKPTPARPSLSKGTQVVGVDMADVVLDALVCCALLPDADRRPDIPPGCCTAERLERNQARHSVILGISPDHSWDSRPRGPRLRNWPLILASPLCPIAR